MIHHDIKPRATLRACSCGYAPHLIEARGRTLVDPRLFGMPARMFHVECCRCGVATTPVWTQATAEHLWATQSDMVPTSRLLTLRAEAERALASAA